MMRKWVAQNSGIKKIINWKVKSEVDLIKESLNSIIDRNISKAKTGNLTENDIFNLTDCFKHLKKETKHINWMNSK